MTTITLNANVVAKIREGVKFSESAIDRIREAAKLAFGDIRGVAKKDLKSAIDKLASDYNHEFKGSNANNLKKAFKDLIWCYAMPGTPVSVPAAGGEVHGTAGDFAKQGKHRFGEAAKQVRDTVGAGRASGGGRKPKNPAGAKGANNAMPASITKPSGEAKLSRSDVLALVESLCDADISGAFSERIADVLKSQGYVVYKRPKK